MHMPKYLVIVESPAKCKTISKFLGTNYELTASYGHVRDLPSRTLGVDVDNNFEPSYSVMKDKSTVVKQLRAAAKKSDCVYLAMDPDREGEAIAWHLAEAMQTPLEKIKRIVFNEISETAVKNALSASRTIDYNLVNAQQARRVLDRLIGYTLSPILSRKIQRGLSAGRVQSVAVKIICDRERAIKAFVPKEYWIIQSTLKRTSSDETYTAKLFAKDTPKTKYEVTNGQEAAAVKAELTQAPYTVDDVVKTRIKRSTYLPFITSTLQQEASRKLNWGAKKTMLVAQRLYEGQPIDGESVGLITYMRTDSTRLSDDAKAAARTYIEEKYGKPYLGTAAPTKKTKTAVQDAHEAIRPVSIHYPPERIKSQVEPDFYKLYTLIWERFISSQMAAATYDRTQIIVRAQAEKTVYFLRATGSILVFDGFTRIYTESTDDAPSKQDQEAGLLPAVTPGEKALVDTVSTDQKFTQPPPRFTEASLVKELEELGIGRPSTYAPTLSRIQDRGYVVKEKKRLSPSELGTVTNEQLESFFSEVLDLKFTANMELKLDDIQDGKHEWQSIVSDYYTPLTSMIDVANKEMKKVSVGERQLGKDPQSGKDVLVRIGRFGPMAQLGLTTDEDKPQFASIDGDLDIKTITLEQALALFNFPKTLGSYDNTDLSVHKGRYEYGPYIKYSGGYVSIPETHDIAHLTLDEAIALIEQKKKEDLERIIATFPSHDPLIQVLKGRYGPYISMDKKNYKIPKTQDPQALTLEACLEIIKTQPKKTAKGRKPPLKKKT